MRAFIIRPFGTKTDRKGAAIDFDRVDRELITPALKALNLGGGTTGEILNAGNIREDMFQLLLTEDLVVADVSIDNANVFYELGIRHALRDKRTFLLRCNGDDVPFDLKTDRYLAYDRDDPRASLEALIRGLRATINGDAQDSPVFKLLPRLKEQDLSNFLAVPAEFQEAVSEAAGNKCIGDLEMLREEIRGFNWESEGLRFLGRAFFALKVFRSARQCWEAIRAFDPGDLEANQKLATIYQRLGEFGKSDAAIERALNSSGLSSLDRAEARSLRGSNIKTQWRAAWEQAPAGQESERALESPLLEKALTEYQAAFEEDLDHYYAGINALSMLVIQARLAEAWPETWQDRFTSEEEALREQNILNSRIAKLHGAVEYSIQATRKRKGDKQDIWLEMSDAQRELLTSTRPQRVASVYRKALAGAKPFEADAERRQLKLYQRLGILRDNVDSALGAFPDDGHDAPGAPLRKERVLLFAGHMLDKPGRPVPRFPPEKQDIARQAIRAAIEAEMKRDGGISYAIAGGSNGGDLIFHEVCEELGVPSQLWLALPPEEYVRVAVQNYIGQGTDKLVDRFRQLQNRLEIRGMAEKMELPRWLRDKPDYDFWRRHTLWIVHNALTVGTENLTLLALWNEEKGNGTHDFVHRVGESGAKVIPLFTRQLFGL
ncbi:MAG: tetratricopeptide repeat-containing protein [Blastocatellia bacterium]